MELLVATLAHLASGSEDDGTTRLRHIAETIQNAPGLVNARFYRSREPELFFSCSPPGKMKKFGTKPRKDTIPVPF